MLLFYLNSIVGVSSTFETLPSCLEVDHGNGSVATTCSGSFHICPLDATCRLSRARACLQGEHPLVELMIARDCLILAHLAKMAVLCLLQWMVEEENIKW